MDGPFVTVITDLEHWTPTAHGCLNADQNLRKANQTYPAQAEMESFASGGASLVL
jgi:hypothetical protein